jgi:hypothetical protein
VTTATLAVLGVAAPAAGADAERTAQRLGLQTVAKHQPGKSASALSGPRGANPFIALLPRPQHSDYAYWKAAMKQKAAKRAGKRALAVEPLLVDEAEPDGLRGGNDTNATAQLIPAFGSAAGKRPAARILGTLAPGAAIDEIDAPPEDNGSIPLAGDSGLSGSGTSTTTESQIGDGPHGSAGDKTGDFDFYAVHDAVAGQRLRVDIDTPTGSFDSVVVLYDAAGNAIAGNDDESFPTNLDSLLQTVIPADGDYFVSIGGYSNLQEDPFDSGSGDGFGSQGPYLATFGLDASDVDVYAVDLRAGDVLGGSVTGSATLLSVSDPAGREVIGSSQDASGIYPGSTRLPGGGNAVFDHVAARNGRHYVAVLGAPGNYDVTLEVYRPGPQAAATTQTIFLDFDGQRVNTATFGGPGVRTLSPLSAFLGRWGIPASRENALINRVVATVKENLRLSGAQVNVLNSRDNPDPFGDPDVSRLVVGGTTDESGIVTIGIAQSIDPGNFDTEETALILLDIVSGPAADDASFNAYLKPSSDRVRFVGTALGNVASHEAGHYLGSFHVDQLNAVLNLMNQGGVNFDQLYGVGPDGIGGTADDPDVDFGEDVFNPAEGFTGIENTAARTRWALHR